jgi:hypothetical protein
MKKVILIVSVALLMLSCGGEKSSAKDIDVNSLETACECGDAVLTVAKEIKVITDAVGDADPSDEQKVDKKTLKKKMREIENHCRKEKGYKKDVMEECESFVEGQKIMENL